MNCDCEV